jgi:glycosyltransferase involved in cell wall biosynthesis
VLIRGLKENNINIIECREEGNNFKLFFNLIKKHVELPKYDIMIVGYTDSRWVVILGWLLCRKIFIWDAFYSLYDSWIFDRKLVDKYSLKAAYYWLMDWLCCKLADKILLDTEEHIKYFIVTFRISKKKFLKIFVGTDDNIFYPREEIEINRDYFLVNFHGKFIPLQGIEYIIKAAKILEKENIKFIIIGSGQEYEKIKIIANDLNLKNIDWHNKVDYSELPDFIASTDICLGIFGNTDKTKRVIPNKVYEAASMAKPIITGDTSAIKELFTNRKNILLCRVADSEDLANKIMELKNNKELRKKIAVNGYNIYRENCTPTLIAKDLLKKLN